MYSNILRILEEIVRIPIYNLVGICKDKLIFLSTKEGITSLWSSDLSGKNLVKLSGDDVIYVAKPSLNDNIIIYSRDISKGKELQRIFKSSPRFKDEDLALDMDPLRIFGLCYKDDRIVYIGVGEKDIGIYMGKVGDEAEKLYSMDKLLLSVDYSNSYIVGGGILTGNPKSTEIYRYNINTGEFDIYTPKEGSNNGLPKVYGNKMLFTSNFEGIKKLYIMDIDGDEPREPEFDGDEYEKYEIIDYLNYGWTVDGKIWFIAKIGGCTKAFLDGYEMNAPDGTIINLEEYHGDIYITYTSINTPNSIFNIGKNGPVKVIGAELSEDIKSRFGKVRFIKYRSYDNLEIPCFIFESYIPKPGPTIIYIHGGPWSEVLNEWRVMLISLIVSGYHVVAPNFRGSTGYGEEFRILDIGDPGGGDLQDIIYARNLAVNEGLASKTAIMGYSYGGFMTFLATVKYPDLWDCGVAGAGVTDWEEMYELSDAAFKQFINILFNGKRDLWKDRSAINYVDRLKAPLCIIHPQNDTRTPLKPILKYCDKLVDLGKTFELHVAPDAGHLITKIENMIKMLYPAIIFLNKYMREDHKK